jgi:hypothetical protein
MASIQRRGQTIFKSSPIRRLTSIDQKSFVLCWLFQWYQPQVRVRGKRLEGEQDFEAKSAIRTRGWQLSY